MDMPTHNLPSDHQWHADQRACRALMRGGSKTFFAASLLLPARVRAPAAALYAFCRLADDAIDLGDNPLQAMIGLRARLDDVYAGRPQSFECDRALAFVVHRFAIPRPLPDALLEGFVWDAQGRRYDTIDELQAYAARVAGTVGAMMALLMGMREPAPLARACDLGVAMQLTNIARDAGEDARKARLYLPRQWMRDEGLDPDAWLAAPAYSPALGAVVRRLLQRADELYVRAEDGIAALPRDCRPAIWSARLVYAEIGRELERQGLDSVRHRAVVSTGRKLALIARATGAAVAAPAPPPVQPPALPQVQFLVDSALAGPVRRGAAARNFGERLHWVIELFERRLAQQRGWR
jgi:phytoene synthase